MKSIKEIIELSTQYFEKHGVESARVEAEWLISHALDMRRMDLYMNFDKPLPEDDLGRIRALIGRRAKSEPVQYICGSTEFYSIPINVGPGVLIPRPETELLVDEALKSCSEDDEVLDLCTGSGAIAISLAKNKKLKITATDISQEALRYARENTSLNEADIEILEGNLFEPVFGRKFHLICSNPPYVKNSEAAGMGPEVLKNEPHLALFAGDDGLDVMKLIAAQGKDFLYPGGKIICELGAEQGNDCKSLFESFGWANVEILKDYSQRDRFVKALS